MANNPEKKTLSLHDILNADDQNLRTEEVPEWNGSVIIKVMSGTERDSMEQSWTKGEIAGARARMLSYCLIDDGGERLFSKSEDVEKLNKKSSLVLDRLFDAAMDVNGMSEKAQKLMEDELKKGEADTSGTG